MFIIKLSLLIFTKTLITVDLNLNIQHHLIIFLKNLLMVNHHALFTEQTNLHGPKFKSFI